MPVSMVICCIKSIASVAKAIYDQLQQVESNNDYCKRILQNVKELEKLSIELQHIDDSDVTDLVLENLMKVNDSLSLITSICNSMTAQGVLKRLIDATSEHHELIQLDTNTQRARESLQMALQLACYNQGSQIREDIRRENQEVRNIVQHAEAGIYINPHVSRPKAVENFRVSAIPEGDLVEVKWTDQGNKINKIDRYELQFDDETSKTIPISSSKITAVDSMYSMRLGEPHLKAGSIYTIKLRAVSGSGPGEWSEVLTFRFKSGSPSRPKKPKLFVISPTEVRVEVNKLSADHERGSPVTHCEVQYLEVEENNEIACEWTSLKVALKGRAEPTDIKKFVIGQLKPHTKYKFRVKMINTCGTSNASEANVVITECLIPGPPQNVRISSKRTSNTLKFRWDPPAFNADGVKNYVVQYRLPKSTEWGTSATLDSTKYSQRVTDLKTDT